MKYNFCLALNATNLSLVVLGCFCIIANFGLLVFRDTSSAGHRHLMQGVAQQSLLHFSGSSDHKDTVSLSAAGGLAKEEIACGPVSTIKVRRTSSVSVRQIYLVRPSVFMKNGCHLSTIDKLSRVG